MNQLSVARRAEIVNCLCEGNSIRSTSRLTGASRTTILSLLEEVGEFCRVYQNHKIRGLTSVRIQCDEIWSFVGAKARAISQGAKGDGDIWTWTALDPDSKLMVCWYVGTRRKGAAEKFLLDLYGRLANRVQLTTDGHNAYLHAVDKVFGIDVDFAQLVKMYAHVPSVGRYSPPVCIGAEKIPQWGDPDPDHISTSFVERTNLTMRMQMRRFTRLTNAFSKKVANHAYAVDIHFMHYNFCRPHMTLTKNHPSHYPTTPAMAAGLTDHVWGLEEVIGMMEPKHLIGAPGRL
jgi:IS1 family transposase